MSGKKLTSFVFVWVIIAMYLVAQIFSPVIVSAQSSQVSSDIQNLYTPFFDPNSFSCDLTLHGSNNPEKVFNFITSKGLSAEQASGITGNLMAESGQGIDPSAVNSIGATGIAQWLGGRKTGLFEFASAKGQNPLTLELQLEYLWFEMTGEPPTSGVGGAKEKAAYEHLLGVVATKKPGVEEATRSFFEKFERAGDNSLPKRVDYAIAVYQNFGGTAISGVSATGGINNCLGVLGDIQCPAVMEGHPTRPGYFKLPIAPNNEYVIYSSPEKRYGSQQLVCILYSVALAYNQEMAGQSKLRIGDLNAGDHKSHDKGVAVDLSGFGSVQSASHIASWKGTYSKEATVLLGRLFVDTGALRNIWWCPPSGDSSIDDIKSYANTADKPIEGQIKCITGHQDHFHVDIKQEYRLNVWTP